MEIGCRFSCGLFLDSETNAHEVKGNPGDPFIFGSRKSREWRFRQQCRFRPFLQVGSRVAAREGVLGPGLERGWETEPQIFPCYWFPQRRVERGSEKTRRPEGHVKLKVYKLKGKKIQRIELPNFTNL